ncbi:hypothetical protein K2X89_09140, partial [Myxococcota bacterium]|nr:hypothetical protein [Myxococcota bacterium]
MRLEPENAAAREALERLQNSSQLPRIARGPFRFRAPGDEAARTHWNERFAADHLGVDEAAAAFQAIVASARNDASARHNLALCLAWNGENRAAIEQ